MGTNARTSTRLALAALLCAGLVLGPVAAPEADAGLSRRHRMLALINEARGQHDRPPLKLNVSLSRKAFRHSHRMADQGSLVHSDLPAMLEPFHWQMGAENIGYGGSILHIQQMFMKSGPHRRNLLNRNFDRIGIGVVRTEETVWVTLVFYG